ncbi:hypothetical protein FPV67DRAFT_1511969 [Lyophyllum atratum]|nr:hypothetical protein FPV67DRAFT_1511969 [Lyophyllum atratum]
MARPVVSYDDITLPYQATSPTQPRSYSPKPSPAKKRKWNKKPKGRSSQSFNNNYNNAGLGPGSSSMAVDAEDENAEEDEESRDLTHNEIWDDSALIDAWNAATEEYEAYNGPDKGWKAEPVHKSPLWYNTPRPKGKAIAPTTANGTFHVPSVPESTAQGDSLPLNFDTFIPSHDPSLAVPIPEPPPIVGAEGLSQAFSDVPCTSPPDTS